VPAVSDQIDCRNGPAPSVPQKADAERPHQPRSRSSLADLPLEVIVEPAVQLPDGLQRLAATLAAFSPRLLLLDPLIRLHRADENSASEMSVILDGLRKLARSSKTAILLVHHARKAAAGNAGTGLRGSSDLHAFGDSNLYLRRLSQDSVLELKIEHRAAAAPAPVRLKLKVDDQAEPSASFEVLDGAHQDDPVASRIHEVLAKSDGPLSSAALREKLGIRNQTVAEALKILVTSALTGPRAAEVLAGSGAFPARRSLLDEVAHKGFRARGSLSEATCLRGIRGLRVGPSHHRAIPRGDAGCEAPGARRRGPAARRHRSAGTPRDSGQQPSRACAPQQHRRRAISQAERSQLRRASPIAIRSEALGVLRDLVLARAQHRAAHHRVLVLVEHEDGRLA
jgi:hypothetical protein